MKSKNRKNNKARSKKQLYGEKLKAFVGDFSYLFKSGTYLNILFSIIIYSLSQ